MTHWWRAEDTSIDHPKLLKLSDAMFRAWYTLNCVASANGGVLPATDDVAVRLRMKPAKVAEWIARLVTAGLYDNEDGIFKPHNWGKRQYKTDIADPTNAERQRRYRNNKRNAVTRNDGNGVTVKRPEAKSETDTEQSRAEAHTPVDEDLKRKASALAAGVSAHFVSRNQPIPSLDRCLLWLTQGYAVGTVLAAIEAVLRRGKAISTLEYFDGAIKDHHAKAAPTPNLQVISSRVFVEEGTLEWTCHQQEAQRLRGRGTPVTDQRDESGRITGRRGWYFDKKFPDGFNDFGERIPASSEENAA